MRILDVCIDMDSGKLYAKSETKPPYFDTSVLIPLKLIQQNKNFILIEDKDENE